MKHTNLLTGLLACFLAPIAPLSAQLSIPAVATPVSVDFTGYAGTGFQAIPDSGQLSSNDWAMTGMSDGALNFGDTRLTGDFARGITTGGVSTGGTYALNQSGDIAILFQPAGSDFNPGTLTLRLQNNTGAEIAELNVDYDIIVINNEDRANSFNFSYSTDNVSYLPVPALDYTSPAARDAGAPPFAVPRNTVLTGLGVPDGAFIYLRWNSADVSGSGSRDELGLDNIVVSAASGASAASFNFQTATLSVSEGDGIINLNVEISEEADCDVDVVLTGGTADEGDDFLFGSPQMLNFSIGGGLSQSVSIEILEDVLLEGPETIVLQLQNAAGGCIIGAVSVATITIEDNDVAPFGECQNLYFSEYIEGSGNNKALEIYNPTGGDVDLSGYTVKVFNNGSTSPSNTQVLSGILADGAVYVIANASADSAVLAVADITSTVTFYNGDDAVVLLNGADTIDVIGRVGEDPGINWPIDSTGATSEFTLVRKPGVQNGQKDWNIGAQEWLVYPQNTFSFLGAHDQDACGAACSTDSLPTNQRHTELGTVFILEWDPQPGAVACQVRGQQLPSGPSPRKNAVSPSISSISVPKSLAGAGNTWTWQVRCACSLDPLDAGIFTAFGDTFTVPGALSRVADMLEMEIYPNPSSDQLFLSWTAEKDASVALELLDISGRLVMTDLVSVMNGRNQISLQVSSLQPGMYWLRLDGKEVGSVQIQR